MTSRFPYVENLKYAMIFAYSSGVCILADINGVLYYYIMLVTWNFESRLHLSSLPKVENLNVLTCMVQFMDDTLKGCLRFVTEYDKR